MPASESSFERYFGKAETTGAPIDRRFDVEEWPIEPYNWPVPVTFVNDGQIGEVGGKLDDELHIVWDLHGHAVKTEEEGGLRMPFSFQALFRRDGKLLCQLLIEVTRAGPVCRQLTLVADPLTATGIRVKLGKLVEEATQQVGFHDADLSHADPEEVLRALGHATAGSQRGKRLSDELLAEVADVYRGALSRGLAPTDAVAAKFPTSRSTAGRWVMEARRRGLLGPAVRGRAGEQAPAKRKEK